MVRIEHLEDARFIVYEDKREEIATYVSAYDMQRQSYKGKLSPNEVSKSPRLHIEHTITHNKTTQTRTFLGVVVNWVISLEFPSLDCVNQSLQWF